MEIKDSCILPVSQQRAWEALNDTRILQASIPGCQSIEADGQYAYALVMGFSVGPIKMHLKGRMLLTNVNAPSAYTIVFEGKGGIAGFGKGEAKIELQPESDQSTRFVYDVTAQVGGKVAQIGSRLINGAAARGVTEFVRRFSEQLNSPVQTVNGHDKNIASNDANTLIIPSGKDAVSDAQQIQPSVNGPNSGADKPKGKRSWKAWISKF
jgi:carbon monoxide dehydrogenase subunit G